MIAYSGWMPVYWFVVYITIAWCVRLIMVPVLLRREFAPGATMAWLGIVFIHPYIGLVLYLILGETRLGPGREQRHFELSLQFRPSTRNALEAHQATGLESAYKPMVLQAEKISQMPIVGGNNVDFLDSDALVNRLTEDIENATSQVHLLYYMFSPDDTGKRLVRALQKAASRGVKCRVLADAVASREFFKFQAPAHQLRASGVEVAAALPVAPIKRRLPRMDLRNHRKAAIIDQRIAYVGSQNLTNADYGGRRGAPWVDLTGRFTGPLAAEVEMVFLQDWAFETGNELRPPSLENVSGPETEMAAQCVPTGPGPNARGFRRILLAAVQCARHRLVLTTPYFVPDETTLVELMMAADRKVEVTLIVPRKADHPFTAMAGNAHYTRLLSAGVQVYQYRPGLIHAKTTTVDDAFAIIGSANLDVRSFNINFELSVVMYGEKVTKQLRDIQMKYVADSDPLDLKQWEKRSIVRQYGERAVSLLSPLL